MEPFFDNIQYNYHKLQSVKNRSYICGYCGYKVSSDRGYKIGRHGDGSGQEEGAIRICPNCQGPSFFAPHGRGSFPTATMGNSVSNVPQDLSTIYEEARRCTGQKCYTGAVLLCRKMLMNIAVEKGAKEGLKFIEYVSFLSDNGYTPPNGKHWVDHIRTKGNEATHEIALMQENDAKDLLTFTEMLLKFIYEFPSMIQMPMPEDTKNEEL